MYKQDYPIFIDLKQQSVIVAGGGITALRKLRRLKHSGASVTVMHNTIDRRVESLCEQEGYAIEQRRPDVHDLQNSLLLFAASDDTENNASLAKLAHQVGTLVNVASQPSASSFLVPSLIDRSPLLVAVTSMGTSPVLARLLTARLEAFIPSTFQALAELVQRHTKQLARLVPDSTQRRHFWERLLGGPLTELILQGRQKEAKALIDNALVRHNTKSHKGEVYLVGAGPGDPDLLTFRALRLMQQCDVVLYDRLVSESIMALVNPTAKKIYVGKKRDQHTQPQPEINKQLADLAHSGHRVLRLKGGDPFLFGRGGEEIETLADRGVSFQVVPGITSATGCAAYAGIPLTHRDFSHACIFVTGHLKDGTMDLDWEALSRPRQTVVVYMGLVGLPTLCEKLIDYGLPGDYPIALVSHGTRAEQQVLTGTLQTLPDDVQEQKVQAPTLIIIGQVVKLRNKLRWFDS